MCVCVWWRSWSVIVVTVCEGGADESVVVEGGADAHVCVCVWWRSESGSDACQQVKDAPIRRRPVHGVSMGVEIKGRASRGRRGLRAGRRSSNGRGSRRLRPWLRRRTGRDADGAAMGAAGRARQEYLRKVCGDCFELEETSKDSARTLTSTSSLRHVKLFEDVSDVRTPAWDRRSTRALICRASRHTSILQPLRQHMGADSFFLQLNS